MENLGTIIQYKFSDKEFGTDYEVREDGKGAYISHWDEKAMGQPEPTKKELKAWSVEVKKELATRKVKDNVGKNIIKRLGAKDKTDAIVQQLNAHRKALVEIQKALNGEAIDTAVVEELGKVNAVIEEELAKLS